MAISFNIHHTEAYPDKYRRFLLEELKVGKKYIVLDVHRTKPYVGHLLQNKVHTICSLTDEPSIQVQLKEFESHQSFLNIQLKESKIPLDDDFVDVAFLDDSALQFDLSKFKQELYRVLRLNSFVILTQRRISLHTTNFSKHLHTYLSTRNSGHSSIASAVSRSLLSELFVEGAYTKDMYYKQHVNLDELIDFLKLDLNTSEKAYQDLVTLFEEHQENGKVVLGLVLQVSYGVFNKYTPEISLRRSLFFHALRPFAFAFYLMVKSNIYLLRILYRVKHIFSRKK